MTQLQEAIAQVAPLYNIALVFIVLLLFAKLFSLKRKTMYLLPWKLLFFAIIIFIVEQSLVILEQQHIVDVPALFFPLFEMIIITSFIYMVLNQKIFMRKKA